MTFLMFALLIAPLIVLLYLVVVACIADVKTRRAYVEALNACGRLDKLR